MIVNDFNVRWTFYRPNKAHAPLIVDADAVLPFAISLQRFELISRRNTQIFQDRRPVKLFQFAKGDPLYVYPSTNTLTKEKCVRFLRLKTLDRHVYIITRCVTNVKREQ